MEISKVALLFLIFGFSACSYVTYQSVAVSDNNKIAVSGTEVSFGSPPKGVVIICNPNKDKNAEYVCNKHYPGDGVDLFTKWK